MMKNRKSKKEKTGRRQKLQAHNRRRGGSSPKERHMEKETVEVPPVVGTFKKKKGE